MAKTILPANPINRTNRLRSRGITLVVSTRCRSAQLAKTLRHYVAHSGLTESQIEVLVFVNPGKHGLSTLYNLALQQAYFDAVCFLHDDLHFLRGARWGLQILKTFQTTDFAALSAAGSVSLEDNGVFWERREHLVGRVHHRMRSRWPVKRTYFSTYSEAFDQPLPVLVLDGLFLAVHRQRVFHAQPFDERFTFHFYDLAFSLRQSLAQGGSCGVLTQLRVVHHSLGEPNTAYWTLREAFVKAYDQHLPAFSPPEIFPSQVFLAPLSPKLLPWHMLSLRDLVRSQSHGDIRSLLAKMAPDAGVWIYDRGLDPACMSAMLRRLGQRFLQGQNGCLPQKPGLLAPRLHYADTHLLFHNGLDFSAAGIVHRGMHQPYAYSLKDTSVDGVLACAVLVRGDILQAALDAPPVVTIGGGNDIALAWGMCLSEQAHRMGVQVMMSGSVWGLWRDEA